jgi:hypothetical protein
MKCGLTKDQLDNTVGIHPTIAEVNNICLNILKLGIYNFNCYY